MHPSSQFILYPLERAPHAIAPGLPVNQEVPAARFSADQDESQEGKGLRIILTALFASFRRMAAELDQLGLFRVQRQRKLREPQAHVLQKPRGLSLMLKSQNTSSRPGELHPQALTEPDVNVSAHPALTVQPLPANINQWAKSLGSRKETFRTQCSACRLCRLRRLYFAMAQRARHRSR